MRKYLDLDFSNEAPKLTKIEKFPFILIQHMKLVFAINSNSNTEKQEWGNLMIFSVLRGFLLQ